MPIIVSKEDYLEDIKSANTLRLKKRAIEQFLWFVMEGDFSNEASLKYLEPWKEKMDADDRDELRTKYYRDVTKWISSLDISNRSKIQYRSHVTTWLGESDIEFSKAKMAKMNRKIGKTPILTKDIPVKREHIQKMLSHSILSRRTTSSLF